MRICGMLAHAWNHRNACHTIRIELLCVLYRTACIKTSSRHLLSLRSHDLFNVPQTALARPFVLEPPEVICNEMPGPSAMSEVTAPNTRMGRCAVCKNDVPVLTFGTLDDHDSMVVRAFREHMRRTFITLGNLACEGQRVLGLVWLLRLGRI